MDELQARFRAIRSLQTEMNLAKQPYPEFEYSDDGQRQGEANVVELPSRQVDESSSDPLPAQRSTAKRKQGAAKRKPVATNQKAFPFRQMRDGHQQPYIDELKRLEAQAERINQLLAERKRKKAQAEQSALTDGTSLSAASAPKKRSAKGSRQTPRSPQREVFPMPAQDDDTEALEAQAERIKQLLKELETALVEGEAMPQSDAIAPESADDQHQSSHASTSAAQVPPVGVEASVSGTYRYGAKAQPFTTNQQEATQGIDQKAQQEATETAQALRYLASRDSGRESVDPSTTAPNRFEPRRTVARSRPPQAVQNLLPIRRYGLQLRQFLQIPQKSFDKVGDAVLWIVLAAAIRVGARFLLALFPALAPVFVLLMFAPAALAVYLALFVPRAGFVSIYRLFLIMLGLLLGGRL